MEFSRCIGERLQMKSRWRPDDFQVPKGRHVLAQYVSAGIAGSEIALVLKGRHVLVDWLMPSLQD